MYWLSCSKALRDPFCFSTSATDIKEKKKKKWREQSQTAHTHNELWGGLRWTTWSHGLRMLRTKSGRRWKYFYLTPRGRGKQVKEERIENMESNWLYGFKSTLWGHDCVLSQRMSKTRPSRPLGRFLWSAVLCRYSWACLTFQRSLFSLS